MSYEKGMAQIHVENKDHYEWKQTDGSFMTGTGAWKNAAQGPGQGRVIEHPPEEWTHKVTLPHSCDSWEIGGRTEVLTLIEDLEAMLPELPV